MEKKRVALSDLALKIKKINGRQGVVIPTFNYHVCDFSKNEFNFYTIEGDIFEHHYPWTANKIENTKIMDKKIKDKLDKFIEAAKEEYELQKDLIKMKEEFEHKKEKIVQKINKKNNNTKSRFDSIVKSQGLTPKEVFEEEFFKTIKSPEDYNLDIIFNEGKIHSIRLEKEVDLGTRLTNSDYDFIWDDEDSTAAKSLEESKDFKRIKNKHFKLVKISKLEKFKVEEKFNIETGDKQSAYVYHTVVLHFSKEFDIKKENIEEVARLAKELIAKM